MIDLAERARIYMLTVVACDEVAGEDGMCECAREHMEQITDLEADLRHIRNVCKEAQADLAKTLGEIRKSHTALFLEKGMDAPCLCEWCAVGEARRAG